MRRSNRIGALACGILLAGFLLSSCAPMPELHVLYRLPAKSNELGGRAVFLKVEDARPSRIVLGQGARKEFTLFPGNVIYSVARHGQTGFRLGPYDVMGMVKDAFQRRLENSGLTLLPAEEGENIQLVIALQKFTLDYHDRQWVGKIQYEASLMKGSQVLATQSISAMRERYKIIGTKGADELMGGLFTDAVNRLNIGKLFEQGHLL